jgi:hypothetical protein
MPRLHVQETEHPVAESDPARWLTALARLSLSY